MKYLLYSLFTSDGFELLNLSYKYGLKPAPTNFKSLLLELNTTSRELSIEKITLGKKLFFDKNLSLGRDISCATCHSFDKGGADGKPTAIGHMNQKTLFISIPQQFLIQYFQKYFFGMEKVKPFKIK